MESCQGLHNLLSEAVTTLLSSVGAESYAIEQSSRTDSLLLLESAAGVISFSGTGFAGTLAVVPDGTFLDRTFPTDHPTDRVDTQGRMTELANRLMGILKARAAVSGVMVDIGLPSLQATGMPLEAATPRFDHREMVSLRYRSGSSCFRILLVAGLAPHVSFADVVDESAILGQPGTMHVF